MKRIAWLLVWLSACGVSSLQAATYYVDYHTPKRWGGTGSADKPFARIDEALLAVPDGSLLLVRPGDIHHRVRLVGNFTQGVTIRSEVPYQARIIHDRLAVACFHTNRGCSGITLEGFEIRHASREAQPLVIQIDGGGSDQVRNITLRDNIIHDSFNNDLLKINNGAYDILVEGNLFYNQGASDEHIDVNSAQGVTIRNNIFASAYSADRNRDIGQGSSYIVVKDSNNQEDPFLGASRINISANVFINWQGSAGHNFILLGEDGKPYYEARDILIENNLMVGDSGQRMRAAFGAKGVEQVIFRHNTITGDLPSSSFAMRLNREGSNPVNRRLSFQGNIWSDPSGSMGLLSEIPAGHAQGVTLTSNLYWNGGAPVRGSSLASPEQDSGAILADPLLPESSAFETSRIQQLLDGESRIQVLFAELVNRYGMPAADSAAVGACPASGAPDTDILSQRRAEKAVTCGAVEVPLNLEER